MRRVLSILFVGASFLSAQADDHPMLLLKQAIAVARTTTKFRAEGFTTGEMIGEGMNITAQPEYFRAAAESPLRTHRENSGNDHTQSTCDGGERLYTGGSGFYRSGMHDGCTMTLADLLHVEDSPAKASLVGRDRIELADGTHNCELIRGEWVLNRGNGVVIHTVNTLCIDPERNLILRYESESTRDGTDLHSVEKLTFTAIDLNPSFSARLFAFSVPTGTLQDEGPQLDTKPPSAEGVYPIGAGVSYPGVVSKVEPVYTKEATDDRVEGLVLVSVTVEPNGLPDNLKIIRRIGHGLDEKAIEAVRQWHFEPGMKNGLPVAVGPIVVAVNFRLP